MLQKRFRVPLISLLMFVPVAMGQQTYTYHDLVRHLYDLQLLAVLPTPGERTGLASSYDRASQYDAKTDSYIKWSANGDGGGIVRQEGDTTVLADITGPGCIWRTWSATAGAGHVKIYLDGSSTPQVDLPFAKFFNRSWAPFNRPNLVYTTAAAGFDNYTPIPFQKSCKIVADKDWGRYYQFTYTQFPSDTVVPTFHADLTDTENAALDNANKILGACGTAPVTAGPESKTETVPLNIAAGAEAIVSDLAGPQAITALTVKLNLPTDPKEQRKLLRQLTLSMSWDSQAQPAVWTPLGDFFGTIGGSEPHSALPLGFQPDGTLYSFWYMPFGKSAHVTVKNDGTDPIEMTWTVSHAALERPIDALGYFHAKWHRDAFNPTRSDRRPDWTLLTTQGRGRYVGTQLHLFQERGPWWGEGDDKFFIDGEKFPSVFGTGSEDYFGYAWSSAKLFVQAFHGQVLRDPGDNANISDYRYHIADNAPFQKSFEGVLEKYLPNDRTLYADVAYWYLDPAGVDPYGPVDLNDRIDYWLNPPPVDNLFFEGVEMSLDWGAANHPRPIEDETLGKDRFMSWTILNQAGRSTQLKFFFKTTGKYRALLRLVKDPQGGTYQLALNDQKLSDPVELYAAAISATEPMDLGTIDLKAGPQSLSITCVGKSANVTQNWTDFGIVSLRLVPVP